MPRSSRSGSATPRRPASSSTWPTTSRIPTPSPRACASRARTRGRCARPSRRRCGSRSTACTCRSSRSGRRREPERMLDAFREIRMGCHHFHGITDATMTHNEAWHFMRLGRMLERADKTSRILDVKYFMLLPVGRRRRHALRRHPLVGRAEIGQRLRDVPQEVRPHRAGRRGGLPGDGQRVPARGPLLHQVGERIPAGDYRDAHRRLPLPLRAADGPAARRAGLHVGGHRDPRRAARVPGSPAAEDERRGQQPARRLRGPDSRRRRLVRARARTRAPER